jgi:hypothetical protein
MVPQTPAGRDARPSRRADRSARDKTERTKDDRPGHGPERSIDRTFLSGKCRRYHGHQQAYSHELSFAHLSPDSDFQTVQRRLNYGPGAAA